MTNRKDHSIKYEIDWVSFGDCVCSTRWSRPIDLEREVGLTHATAHRAWWGKPIGAAFFLAICNRANLKPLQFLEVIKK